MREIKTASTRVAYNTMIIYARMLITIGMSLYSTRLVLNALGASDYGIYNLVAGVIAMLSFLNVAMAASTQRYLSYHQGTGDYEMQKKIFTNSWILQIAIGLVLVFLFVVVNPFLFNGFLNIDPDKIFVAKAIYYFMSVSVFFSIISVPFSALLNAHENMSWIAVVNVIESVIKLLIALSLNWFIQTQRLIAYGILMVVLYIISFFMYTIYCLKKYKECSIKNYKIDKPLLKEITGFAGWNLYGALCGIGNSQGLTLILNVFFGTIVNAAYGVANQINGQLSFFSATMLRVLNPQIMISEGKNDRQRMLRLSMMASKFGFFFIAFIAIPVIFEMSAILKIWLKNVPEYAVEFCSLILIASMTQQLTFGLESAAQATGRIKIYQSVVGSILLFNLPIAYLLLKNGFSAYYVFVSAIIIQLFASAFRLFYLKIIAGLSVKEYFERVFLKEIIPVLMIVLSCWTITRNLDFKFRFFLTSIFSVIVFIFFIYYTGLCKDEKMLVNGMLKKIIKDKYSPKMI